jgi:hypothetical protein
MKFEYGCFVDGPEDIDPTCVFDLGRVNDCCVAIELKAKGLGKDKCVHWHPILLKNETSEENNSEENKKIDMLTVKQLVVPGYYWWLPACSLSAQ